MNKYQYMVITVGAIFCVLLLIGFGILVNLTFKEKKMSKKVASCPDYWTEEKDVLVVDVNPNTDFIYKDSTSFVKYQRKNGKSKAIPTGDTASDFTRNSNIGNNVVQDIRIMLDKNIPLLRINNEVTKKITACKVPVQGAINVGNIYSDSSIKLRNFSYGSKYNNLRGNYTTQNLIPSSGRFLNIKYDTRDKIYKLNTLDGNVNIGDSLSSPILTPGFYWKANCISGNAVCLSGKDDTKVEIWGNNSYTPSEFYIDFNDNYWHTYNMNKSTKCNIKRWANANEIVWDGITNLNC
jgi:hypothetical protein